MLEKRLGNCKDSKRKGDYYNIKFDFLGYTFKPRKAKSKQGELFTGFLPAMSDKAQKAVREKVRSWKLQIMMDKSIKDIAGIYNSKIRGWINYYAHYYKTEVTKTMRYIDKCLVKWVKRKYKKTSKKKAIYWLEQVAKREPKLFAHWNLIVK